MVALPFARRWVPTTALLLMAACSSGEPAITFVDDTCGAVRTSRTVYNGTPEPTELPLSPGQILAIGTFGGCSGTFIHDEWVLSAEHCSLHPGGTFCVGNDPMDPDTCFDVEQVENHPELDLAVVRVSPPASERAPLLQPIAINTMPLTSSIIGTIAEAAGYGRQEDGTSGEREFTAQPIVALDGNNLVIDGMGERGVCFGDSGGPVMILDGGGGIRVAGDLSFGNSNCVGRDQYARTDLVADWIEDFTGATGSTGGCGSVSSTGDCLDGDAIWCENGRFQRETCATCGWDTAANGFRCITGADPCEGLDATGECRDDIAVWCDHGQLRRRDCGGCGERCAMVRELNGAYCLPDECGDLDEVGECAGSVARWCVEGEVRERDCNRLRQRCTFDSDEMRHTCVN